MRRCAAFITLQRKVSQSQQRRSTHFDFDVTMNTRFPCSGTRLWSAGRRRCDGAGTCDHVTHSSYLVLVLWTKGCDVRPNSTVEHFGINSFVQLHLTLWQRSAVEDGLDKLGVEITFLVVIRDHFPDW